MKVTVHFFFSFPNVRLRQSYPGNIRGRKQECGVNSKSEDYNVNQEYDIKREGSFSNKLEIYLNRFVRRNPSLKKCMFSCDFIPNRQIPLGDEYNKKLTPENIKKIVGEITGKARRRFQNPTKMM